MTSQDMKFVAKNVVPYNTGKILIGGMYIPPSKTNTMSRDEAMLQRALLCHQPRIGNSLAALLCVSSVKTFRRIANLVKTIRLQK